MSNGQKIYYTEHAKKRMREREITEDEVEYCINRYDISYTGLDGNTIYRVTLPNGKRIKTVVRADSTNPTVVITVATIDE